MIPTLRPLTFNDLVYMPDDGQRYEIISGELIVSPAPTAGHQRVLSRLDRLIADFRRQTNAGELFAAPLYVVLDHHDVVAPDLAFLANAKSHPQVQNDVNSAEGVPNVVVEVIAPTTPRIDRVRKMAVYASAGVPEYWIADPDRRTLEIYILEDKQYAPIEADGIGRLASRELSGLRVNPSEIFTGLDSRLGVVIRRSAGRDQIMLQRSLQ